MNEESDNIGKPVVKLARKADEKRTEDDTQHDSRWLFQIFLLQCTLINSKSLGHSNKDRVMKTSSYPMEIYWCKKTMGQGQEPAKSLT